jgi:hypothetical protein
VAGLFAFAFLVIASIIALGGTGMAMGGDRVRDRLLARRGLRYRWTVRVADVGDDCDVKLEGAAVPLDGGGLEAPFSARRCVAYELTLFDLDGVRPTLLAREVVACPFLLRDGSGTAHVLPVPARIGIQPDKQWRYDPIRPPAARVQALLVRHGVAERARGRTLLVCEGVLEVGVAVAVFGHATQEPDPATPGLYRTVETRPLLTGSDSEPLLLAASSEV